MALGRVCPPLVESAFLQGAEKEEERFYLPNFIVLLTSFINKVLSAFFILIIKTYKATLSPFLGSNCRFDPTCSEYGLQAFQNHQPTKALFLLTKRIFRCHPFNAGGADPIPKP